MSSSNDYVGIPISQAQALHHSTPKLEKVSDHLPEGFEDFQTAMAKFEKRRNGPDPQDMVRQIAQQSALKAKTVFRSGSKVVAVQYQNGSVMYPQGGDAGGAIAAGKQADALGLSGQQRMDFIAEQMAQKLQSIYGAGLQVQSYDSASAPSQGELHAEVFGAPSQKPSSLWAGSFDAQTLQMMDDMLADMEGR